MKINHMICPNCGHDFYVDCSYATCDACQTCFYASYSGTVSKVKYDNVREAKITTDIFVNGKKRITAGFRT